MADRELRGLKNVVDTTLDAAGGLVGRAGAVLTSSAQSFVESAAVSDSYEIEAGRLAERRSSAEDVRQIARQMVHDHTDSTQKLTRAAGSAGIRVPEFLDKRRQAMIDHLREVPDDKFDEMYLDQQVLAHEEAVSLLHHFRKAGDDATLRAFAAEVSPVIESHLANVKRLQGA